MEDDAVSGQTPIAVITSDGTTVRVDQGHRAMGGDAMDAAQAYAIKAAEHLWVATVCHRLSAAALDASQSEPLNFDAESLIMTAIGCYVCEEPWEPTLTRRRCKGEPR
jgi:hypothetical protein